jgi:hypothetical protein
MPGLNGNLAPYRWRRNRTERSRPDQTRPYGKSKLTGGKRGFFTHQQTICCLCLPPTLCTDKYTHKKGGLRLFFLSLSSFLFKFLRNGQAWFNSDSGVSFPFSRGRSLDNRGATRLSITTRLQIIQWSASGVIPSNTGVNDQKKEQQQQQSRLQLREQTRQVVDCQHCYLVLRCFCCLPEPRGGRN